MSTHRQAQWVVRLLDQAGGDLGVLDGISGGSVSVSASTRLRSSGSLTIRDTGQAIDWLSHMVRIEYQEVGGDSWPVGVFLLASPRASYSDEGISWDVDLLSVLAIVDEARVASTYTVAPGVNLVERARALAASAGVRVASTPSASVSSQPMTWDPGTSYLTIVNDLLDAAGYWAAFPDGEGLVHLDPYARPAQRVSAYRFEEGEEAIHLAEWDRDQDLASVPNKVILVGQGSDSAPALVGIATNEDPKSSFSYQARGRWITRTETGVEAADQATLTALARRRLIDASTPTATLSIQHLPIRLTPNDRVGFTSQGIDVEATVQKIEYDLSPTALMKTTLKEVIDL